MNDDLMGHLVLKRAYLDNHYRNQVVGAACREYNKQTLAASVRSAVRTKGFLIV